LPLTCSVTMAGSLSISRAAMGPECNAHSHETKVSVNLGLGRYQRRMEPRWPALFDGAMCILVRFPLGRVVLHLIAMAGDGCFRFHAAGIGREVCFMVPFLVRAPTEVHHG
jgi:hypothetical protein